MASINIVFVEVVIFVAMYPTYLRLETFVFTSNAPLTFAGLKLTYGNSDRLTGGTCRAVGAIYLFTTAAKTMCQHQFILRLEVGFQCACKD